MSEEKIEKINNNKIVIYNKNNKKYKSLFSNFKINIFYLYFFLLKSFLKGWYLRLILIMFFCPIILSTILYLVFSSNHLDKILIFGINLIFLINSFVITNLIVFNFIGYFKFTNIQNKIGFLNFKFLGILLTIFLSILTYVLFANFITIIFFLYFVIKHKIQINYIFNWLIIFYFIYSVLFTFFLSSIYLLILPYFKSLNFLMIFSEFSVALPLIFFYILFILFPKIISNNSFNIYLTFINFVHYFISLLIFIFLDFLITLLFLKKFSWKK